MSSDLSHHLAVCAFEKTPILLVQSAIIGSTRVARNAALKSPAMCQLAPNWNRCANLSGYVSVGLTQTPVQPIVHGGTRKLPNPNNKRYI